MSPPPMPQQPLFRVSVPMAAGCGCPLDATISWERALDWSACRCRGWLVRPALPGVGGLWTLGPWVPRLDVEYNKGLALMSSVQKLGMVLRAAAPPSQSNLPAAFFRRKDKLGKGTTPMPSCGYIISGNRGLGLPYPSHPRTPALENRRPSCLDRRWSLLWAHGAGCR